VSTAGAREGFTISIISHGQARLIRELLGDIERLKVSKTAKIVLTINVPEDETLYGPNFGIVDRVIRNTSPKGFGANHNAAFEGSSSRYFVIVNPDIRLQTLDLTHFSAVLQDSSVGACAPVVTTPDGAIEDSFRRFPSILRLVRRVFLRQRTPDYPLADKQIDVDWAAGMFVVYDAEAYQAVDGFDEEYFMYMEDADICRRLLSLGFRVIVQPAVTVIHDAQRASMKDWHHLAWHLRSMIRFLYSI
jgi:GT2 family glycosyltransferase